ncbi:NAD(P)-dependent alcohol dehydrogenase [Leptospira sp. 2 VSF19]|uniref:NAD(P)-dependent alcohol dehydrogenase n=1 Tax=Leptospira soteropolitanensis TaxID=2950025 RepID=A0AAW5VCT8_9LEPT|nr:NAD(P)-dependent alcohol dehydrogenase [Leptospira soteropolitanensis]MCW7492647.1 NAD(P)-dependent alcohol dehydrogenase [Leptospira soteropolitanensis]MCW7500330.1 NAD(P)-dependent alcohol dehydrogenase [Leptospira soteropolitanensis]MCW7522635.1 NAD(P)-dependent alcohol dehydrogenase [Leptospira soteropolitanensis]MCW7526491.1 NAD(P)-dependent alcohol dehydrogenase [Leptospira soteropolitanensis]MCW7530300.1 NAD(P)-dependent alcohol dehydrogenase [Leptospira soteropolitanensis]
MLNQVWEIQGSFGLENLKKSTRDLSESLAPKEVLVRLTATSLNYRDYLMVIGTYNPRQKLPLIPCSDGAGVVEAVGSEVSLWKKGDRVLPIFAQRWMDGAPNMDNLRSTLGGPHDGCLANYGKFQEEGLVATPSHLTDKEAATLGCAGLTAYNAVVNFGGIEPGSDVLCLGTGGVSLFSLQFAKMMGARVIITSSSDEKLARAKSLGADETINYATKSNWERDVRKHTKMAGADLIIEVGGAGTMQKSMMSVKPYGTIALIGVLAGGESSLSLYPILMQGVKVQGVIVGSRADFEKMNRAIEKNKMKPVVDKVFGWEEVPEALAYLQTGKHFGKVVVSWE